MKQQENQHWQAWCLEMHRQFFTLGLHYNSVTTEGNSCWNGGVGSSFRFQRRHEPKSESSRLFMSVEVGNMKA